MRGFFVLALRKGLRRNPFSESFLNQPELVLIKPTWHQ